MNNELVDIQLCSGMGMTAAQALTADKLFFFMFAIRGRHTASSA